MIPKKITLHNFLSYRQAELDFTGLHTACICGENGAGKSSLLEAISWAVWGKTRTSSDDDLIYLGEKSMRVNYEFIYNQEIYRIIRSRQKNRTSSLDFQILSGQEFQSLSGKKIVDTQRHINDCLKIDYHTFTNSAYLRQGKADEFMQKKPADRKKILANLLKLEQYDTLADKAKNLEKEYKFRTEEIRRNLDEQKVKIEEKQSIVLDLKNTEKELEYHHHQAQEIQSKLQKIQSLNNNHKSWQERLVWQQNNWQNSQNKTNQLNQEKQSLQGEINKLSLILAKKADITANYHQLEQFRQEDSELNLKFNSYQKLLSQKQKLEKQLSQTNNQLILQIEREKTNLNNLNKEEKELNKIIGNSNNLTDQLEQLKKYRQTLAQLDKLQLKITPLIQRKNNLESDFKAQRGKLEAKLEQLIREETQLQTRLAEVPQIRSKYFALDKQLQKISDTRSYQERVKEKGIKQGELKQQYISQQNSLIKQQEKLQKKLEVLNKEQAICPLCERDLDEHHRHYVIDKTEKEGQQMQSESWYLEEQLIIIERKLEDLRKEYTQLEQELSIEDSLKQESAKLENKLDLTGELYEKSEEIEAEKEKITQLLANNQYAPDLSQELAQIKQKITELNYNEKDHALLRTKESELRKVEYQQLKIRDSQKKLAKLSQEKPELETKINKLENELQILNKNSPLQIKIQQIEQEIREINYHHDRHNYIRQEIKKLQSYQLIYTDLQQAEKQHPNLVEKLNTIQVKLQSSQQEEAQLKQECEQIRQQLAQLTDYSEELNKLEGESTSCQQNINQLLTKKGRLQQSLNNLEDREETFKKLQESLQETKKKYRIYHNLGEAFGKNGIQSLMIENILPELEIEANHILSRLTGNQLHVQFITQKPKVSKSKSGSSFKDTLEIIIADASGTRSYETYSGGEAFRINFSIRLALSRILAQRSGTALQLLIVDEGFGTQDSHGCERLIAALNAIASEFSCILTVTHINQFKEAFDTRIEVYKTKEGSQIRISS